MTTKRLGNDYAWCVLSDDEKYRYELGRVWVPSRGLAVFCMMNPSVADDVDPDLTLTKCVGFAQQWNLGGVILVNAFALRSTNPRRLLHETDPIGPENDRFITDALLRSARKMTIAAWGGLPKPANGLYVPCDLPLRIQRVERLCLSWHCLGITRDGFPKHPSRIAYDTKLNLLSFARRGIA